jgi:hypothetical protein
VPAELKVTGDEAGSVPGVEMVSAVPPPPGASVVQPESE